MDTLNTVDLVFHSYLNMSETGVKSAGPFFVNVKSGLIFSCK